MQKKTIINVGSINVDHVYRVPYFVKPGETLPTISYQRVLGGKGANQSVALARAGEKVRHVGAIGEDHRWILDELSKAAVAVDDITVADVPTGHALIQVDDNAENCILLYPGANHALALDDIGGIFKTAEPDSWVLFQNEMPNLGEMIVLAKAAGAKVAVNPAPFDTAARDIPFDKIDLLIVNDIEAEELAASLPGGDEQALTRLCPLVIITRGTKGAICHSAGENIEVPAFVVEAVDTTGAGDTFVGYILSSLASGMNIANAMQRASAASALAVTKPGASVAIPTSAEVQAFIDKQNEA
ncbi:ribokinase [Kiloniella laminariae]|uniref:Ribokinase n=1 Tax=Kiloniella laminariae TaxID=454162 RepID=A0ABT4LGH6_9PROT|nr:ribokinase [Kiloniella laminariae]MCZ4280199.1 ribokinase [Kiloniella laminariae]